MLAPKVEMGEPMQRRSEIILGASVVFGCLIFVAGCGGATTAPATSGEASTAAQSDQTGSTVPATNTASAAAVQSATPSATSVTASGRPDIRYFEQNEIAIPAGLSDEDLVAAFIERSTAWGMAATSPEVYDRYMKVPRDTDLLYESRMAHGTYVTELFVDINERLSDKVVSSFLDQRLDRVDKVSQKYFASVEQAKAQPDVYEPYMEWYELLEITSATRGKGSDRYFMIEYQLKSNDEKTQPSFGKPDDTPPYPVRAQITFNESSGHALIKDINVGPA